MSRDSSSTNENDLRSRLTDEQFEVTQNKGTEAPFSGEYHDTKEKGMYVCVVCGEPLFSSDTKYDSGSGWPSFYKPANDASIVEREDTSHGMIRTEVTCQKCGAHLGHVFPDGPTNHTQIGAPTDAPEPTGQRYCLNSAALALNKDTNDTEK